MRSPSVIGTGNMGSALVRGLIRSGKMPADRVVVFDLDETRSQALKAELGVVAANSASSAITPDTDMAVLAVKPQQMGEVLDKIAGRVADTPVVVSIAAGISTEFILSRLDSRARVIRAMPNAAAMVGQSATAVCKAGGADDSDLQAARDLFTAFGRCVVVKEELMNVVTALSGSGPGYIFAMMEAFTDGAVRMGLDRPTARDLTIQTFAGAAAMAAQGNVPFSELKDRITSPGGTTIVGLQVMERSGLRGILMDAVEAATRRGEELSRG